MRDAYRQGHRSSRGFSLVELLVVIGIIGILGAISVGGIQRIVLATNLTTSASMVVDALNLARQRAVSSNCPVEVRFYQVPDSAGSTTLQYRAMGIYQINTDGPQLIHAIMYLTGKVIFSNSQTYGTLLSYSASTTGPLIPNGPAPNYTYSYFQYRPDGSTNLNTQPASASTDTWHVMLYNSTQPPVGTNPPSNYISIQLDPVSGRTETFQP